MRVKKLKKKCACACEWGAPGYSGPPGSAQLQGRTESNITAVNKDLYSRYNVYVNLYILYIIFFTLLRIFIVIGRFYNLSSIIPYYFSLV